MPLPHGQPAQYANQQPQQQQHQQQQAAASSASTSAHHHPMGRSQSAFNFLLSKAKAPFSSSSASNPPGLNSSTSLSSLSADLDDGQDDTNHQLYYHRQLQTDHAFPQAPPSVSTKQTGIQSDRAARATTSESQVASSRPNMPFSKPSFSEEHSASPSKKGFFAGISRDKKPSSSSSKVPQPQRPNTSQSPLAKGLRQDASSTSYAQFSKSQSDLHARPDQSSPNNHLVDLPRIPGPYQQHPASADRNRFLRSPSPAMNFSRSVDDLSSSLPTSNSPFPSSPGHNESGSTTASSASAGNWGEQSNPALSNWRSGDIGTIAPAPQQPSHRIKATHGTFDSVTQTSPSTASAQSPAPTSQLNAARPDTKHSRKVSKLTGKDSTARGMVASSLAATLGLAQGPMMTSASSPVALPQGATFQGFLSRNANISLSLAQLNEYDSKGKDKEKDIAKGWKPYRVVLQDGKLSFYKPPNSYADEVKALFPTSIIRGTPLGEPGSQDPSASLSPEALVRGGLSKSELLMATSSTVETPSSQASPNLRARMPAARSPSNKTISLVTSPATANAAGLAWAVPGKHSELLLVEHIEPPKRWVDRILSGSIDALANEFVRATQAQQIRQSDSEVKSDIEAFVLAVLCCTILSGTVADQDEFGNFLTSVHKWAQSTAETMDATSRLASTTRLCSLCKIVVQAGLAETYESHLQTLAIAADLKSDDLEAMIKDSQRWHVPLAQATPRQDWTALLAEQPEQTRDDLRELRNSMSISDEMLLRLEPLELAQQIQAYHALHLPSICQGSLTVSEILKNAAVSKSVGAFSFDPASPHPVTTLALSHLLRSGPDSAQTSANTGQVGARHRASVLRHWIAVASYLLSLGDVAGWLAVSVALCSKAVVRLEQTWRYLAEGDRLLVAREWAPVLSSLSWVEGPPVSIQHRMSINGQYAFVEAEDGKIVSAIPYLGNGLSRLLTERGGDSVRIAALAEHAVCLAQAVSEWQSTWHSNPVPLAAHVAPLPEYQATLELLFDASNDGSAAYMERSFELEPKTLGALDVQERDFLPPATNPALPLVPLLFPQALPVLSLLNATKIFKDASQSGRRSTEDTKAAATSRNMSRKLGESPLKRSSAFSPQLGGKNLRMIAFSGVLEWNHSPLLSYNDASNILRVGNELVLRVVPEPNLSLPTSPMLTKRFSQDFGRSPRPLSQVSKRSSLPASNRNSVIDVIVPVQVVVKFATLGRLIDLLVMGVEHVSLAVPQSGADFADSFGGPMRKNKLNMDLDNFRATFLATFRSLCSPTELFEQLRRRFAAAINASKELSGAEAFQPSSQFPSWMLLTPVGSHVEPTDWEMVCNIRMGVIQTLRLWIDRFPQDFADDETLYRQALAFIRKPDIDTSTEVPEQQKVVTAIAQLRNMFSMCIMGANARQEERWYVTNQPVQIATADSRADFDFDQATPASLVEYLESIATVFFDKIIDRDLLVASEIFESQASSPTAWFVAKHGESASKDDEKPVNSMYTLLDTLKSPRATSTDVTLQHKLPAAVRDALAAQSLFRGWIAIHIIESGIGLERRQNRLLKLIDALWICRSRMARLRDDVSAGGGLQDPSIAFHEPTIGSFVESAIVSTLSSSESRIFLRAWQGVAITRHAKGDGLVDLFPKDIDSSMRATTELSSTPDIGWLLACLAEATTRRPVVHDNADLELIDFDKRRTIWALIDGAMRVRPVCGSAELIDLAGTRLKLMQSSLTRVSWDRRAFKEDAANEMQNAPPILQPSSLRPSSSAKALSGLSKQQQEKLRRDRVALEALESALAGPSISSRMSSMPSSSSRSALAAPQPSNNMVQFTNVTQSPQTAPPDKATVRSRRMTALFKGAVRPLMTSEKHDVPARSVAELMRLTPLQKPSIVAGLGGAQISAWNNGQRSFVFHLTSEEGAKYLLQAPSGLELNEWIGHVSKVAREKAPRKPIADASRPGAPVRSKSGGLPIFGRPLREIVEREGTAVPMAMERMFAEIEARGLREVGIYRISGSKSAVDGLRRAWDQLPSEAVDLAQGDFSDIHTITGSVKSWLRELPDPVITYDSYDAIIATNNMENDDRLYAMRDIIWRLPKCHFDMLRRTAEHLARVVEEGEHNKMLSHNIGLIFGTSLLNPPPGPSSVAIGFGNIGKAANVVKTIVTMYEWLFEPEPGPEAEPELQVQRSDENISAEPNAVGEIVTTGESQPERSTDADADDDLAETRADVDEEEEEEEVPELVEQPRRTGRRRPLTIMGIESLGSHEQAMLRSCSEDNSDMGTPVISPTANVTESPHKLDLRSARLSDDEEADGTAAGMPTIVLSREEDTEDELPSSSSSINSRGVDEALEKLTASASLDDASSEAETCESTATSPGLPDPSMGEAVPRPAKARPLSSLTPGGGYRDSIYSSYSIYADSLDNMRLENQSSASSMVANRRSAVMIPSATAAALEAEPSEMPPTAAGTQS